MESEVAVMANSEYPSPEDALAEIQRGNTAVADNFSRHTWSYDLIYSVLVAAMVAGWALKVPIALGIEAVCLLALFVLARTWANRHGVWITGIKPPKARWIAILMGLSIGAILLVNLIVSHSDLPVLSGVRAWVPAGTGVVAFLLALRGSRLWRHVYRREMGLPQ